MGDSPNAGTPGEIYFLYDRVGKKPPPVRHQKPQRANLI
jgi:hypothetical protein